MKAFTPFLLTRICIYTFFFLILSASCTYICFGTSTHNWPPLALRALMHIYKYISCTTHRIIPHLSIYLCMSVCDVSIVSLTNANATSDPMLALHPSSFTAIYSLLALRIHNQLTNRFIFCPSYDHRINQGICSFGLIMPLFPRSALCIQMADGNMYNDVRTVPPSLVVGPIPLPCPALPVLFGYVLHSACVLQSACRITLRLVVGVVVGKGWVGLARLPVLWAVCRCRCK